MSSFNDVANKAAGDKLASILKSAYDFIPDDASDLVMHLEKRLTSLRVLGYRVQDVVPTETHRIIPPPKEHDSYAIYLEDGPFVEVIHNLHSVNQTTGCSLFVRIHRHGGKNLTQHINQIIAKIQMVDQVNDKPVTPHCWHLTRAAYAHWPVNVRYDIILASYITHVYNELHGFKYGDKIDVAIPANWKYSKNFATSMRGLVRKPEWISFFDEDGVMNVSIGQGLKQNFEAFIKRPVDKSLYNDLVKAYENLFKFPWRSISPTSFSKMFSFVLVWDRYLEGQDMEGGILPLPIWLERPNRQTSASREEAIKQGLLLRDGKVFSLTDESRVIYEDFIRIFETIVK